MKTQKIICHRHKQNRRTEAANRTNDFDNKSKKIENYQ